MSSHDFWSMLSSLVTSPATLGYILFLTDRWRVSARTRNLILLCTTPLVMLLECVIFVHADNIALVKSQIAMLDFAYTLGVSLLLTPFRQGRLLFVLSTAGAFTFVSATLTGQFPFSYGLARLCVKIAFNLLFIFLIRRYFSECLRSVHSGKRGMWYELSLIPLLYYIVFCYSTRFRGTAASLANNTVTNIAVLFVFISAYITFYCLLTHLRRHELLQRDNAVLDKRLETLRSEILSDENLSQRNASFRKDMSEFLDAFLDDLDRKDDTAAFCALDALSERISAAANASDIKAFTGNTIIDSVLSGYAERTAQAGIPFSISLRLPEDEVLDTSGLAVVLSNGLENALHACEALPPYQKRFIELAGDTRGCQFILQLRNSYAGEIHFDPVTHCPSSKRDGHGYGTQSIAAFAQKHGAMLDFSAQRGVFTLRILL